MTTVKIQGDIDSKGILRVEAPVGLPPGRAEVVVVVQSDNGEVRSGAPLPLRTARSGLFDATSREIDIEAALTDMNDGWKSEFSELP